MTIMPTLNVEENIKNIEKAIEELTQEVFRLQGSLRVFRSFRESGLKEVDIPQTETETDESNQE